MSAAVETGPAVTAHPAPRIARSRRRSAPLLAAAVVVVALLAYAPYAVTERTTDPLITFFILLTVGTMWNVLAGYAGLVSVGQQAYIGLGAYGVLFLSQHGVQTFVAIPISVAGCAVVAFVVSFLLFRLEGGYFAIATWVVAEVCFLLVIRVDALGGGTGGNITTLGGFSPALLDAITYWIALSVGVLTVAGAYLLLRSRLGLSLTAVRDNAVAAGSVGIRVTSAKRLVYVFASAGAAAAGGVLILSQLDVQPSDQTGAFGIIWSAYMLFIVLIGGLGSLEGPILGTIVFFTLQQLFGNDGPWYLIALGLVAIVMAVYLRRGLWGLVERFGVRLFPVGYWVRD